MNSAGIFSFKGFGLVLQPTTLVFGFRLATLINLASISQLFLMNNIRWNHLNATWSAAKGWKVKLRGQYIPSERLYDGRRASERPPRTPFWRQISGVCVSFCNFFETNDVVILCSLIRLSEGYLLYVYCDLFMYGCKCMSYGKLKCFSLKVSENEYLPVLEVWYCMFGSA